MGTLLQAFETKGLICTRLITKDLRVSSARWPRVAPLPGDSRQGEVNPSSSSMHGPVKSFASGWRGSILPLCIPAHDEGASSWTQAHRVKGERHGPNGRQFLEGYDLLTIRSLLSARASVSRTRCRQFLEIY